jgi:transcriptional regulator of acetoin/glycerol metabolism
MSAAAAERSEGALRMTALAYLYDNLRDLPTWLQRLTPVQMEQLAAVLTGWQAKSEKHEAVLPIEEIEQREFTRALILFNGDVCAAAKALGIGKTTFYRKMKSWGFSATDWRLIIQAAALGGGSPHLPETLRQGSA